jgi:ABC-type branched-subunit amino acid transport system ATPase component
MARTFIEVDKLTKHYGNVKAVDGISFQVNRAK